MFAKNKKIEDLIFDILSEGQTSTLFLIKKIKEIRPATTKQAVYKALRLLRTDEIIIQNREEVSLSSIWIKKLADFTEKAELHYKRNDQPSINFLGLKQGEKISYSFKTFETTDMFWCHAFDVLADIIATSSPLFLYYPHEWFFLARIESEMYLFDNAVRNGKKIFCLAGNKDPLDDFVSKYFDSDRKHYFASAESMFKVKSNYYVNAFDDFLIEVWLDPKISEALDLFYKETKVLDEQSKDKILAIIKQKGRNKLVISRNKRKADAVRHVFSKFFIL